MKKLAPSRLKKNQVKIYHWIPVATMFAFVALGYGIKSVNDFSLQQIKDYKFEKQVFAKEEVKIELKEVTYTPSSKTIKLINANPDLSSKIKTTFGDEWLYAAELIARESSFNKFAINPTSGACYLFQALPCEKMKCEYGDEDCQLLWGSNYIKQRYGSAKKALEFHDLKKAECLAKDPNNTKCAGWY